MIWLFVQLLPKLRRGQLTDRDVLQSCALLVLLAAITWTSRYGTFERLTPGKLEPGPVNLAYVWYPLVGGLVAFFFGWLLSGRAPAHAPDSNA